MMVGNPNRDHVNINVHTKFAQILSICSQDIEQKRNSDTSVRKKTVNNPYLELVNMNVCTKFGPILSFRSQDIERKLNFDIYEGPSLSSNFQNKTINNPNLDLVNVDVHTSAYSFSKY